MPARLSIEAWKTLNGFGTALSFRLAQITMILDESKIMNVIDS
jgi:hypothetical protein